jgi:hypothetical protein
MTREWSHQTQTARRVAPVRGIRVRLMVLAIIAIVPLVISRIYDEQRDRAERIAAAFRQARALAQEGADKQNEYLATTRSFLQVIARSYPMFGGGGRTERAHCLFQQLGRRGPRHLRSAAFSGSDTDGRCRRQ